MEVGVPTGILEHMRSHCARRVVPAPGLSAGNFMRPSGVSSWPLANPDRCNGKYCGGSAPPFTRAVAVLG